MCMDGGIIETRIAPQNFGELNSFGLGVLETHKAIAATHGRTENVTPALAYEAIAAANRPSQLASSP
jgi:hypothetical protein